MGECAIFFDEKAYIFVRNAYSVAIFSRMTEKVLSAKGTWTTYCNGFGYSLCVHRRLVGSVADVLISNNPSCSSIT